MLENLYSGAIADSEARRELISSAKLEESALSAPPALDAILALEPRDRVHVIAEIKRASPSKGALAEISDPVRLAKTYESAGASAISVLTEQRQFLGSLSDLEAVSQAVRAPLLRKDFIANEYQILEARAHGADMFLLIVAGLSEDRLLALKEFGEQLGMTPLIETHTRDELKLATSTGARLIGVNARNLSTFETDRNLFASLVDDFARDTIKIAESAVRSPEDVKHYRESGADVVLVGEALVTSDPEKTLREFLKY